MFFVVILGSLTLVAGAQTVSAPKMNVLADSVTSGELTELHGHVRVAACAVVTAEDAVIHTASGDIDLSGSVHMKLTNGIDPLR
jgi:hypothetical protein